MKFTSSGGQADIYQLIDSASSSHKSIQETLYLLSIPGLRDSIKDGLKTPIALCHEKLKWQNKRLISQNIFKKSVKHVIKHKG